MKLSTAIISWKAKGLSRTEALAKAKASVKKANKRWTSSVQATFDTSWKVRTTTEPDVTKLAPVIQRLLAKNAKPFEQGLLELTISKWNANTVRVLINIAKGSGIEFLYNRVKKNYNLLAVQGWVKRPSIKVNKQGTNLVASEAQIIKAIQEICVKGPRAAKSIQKTLAPLPLIPITPIK